ncbi:hypothetical protein I4U23_027208 [Adineta vaga]|nr:hypothetical protein I4U23_027208 [Adineta vaga]
MSLIKIPVHFKQTGEIFDVEVSPQSTPTDIIKNVCARSVITDKIDWHDYYLTLNNTELLDDHQTLQENSVFRTTNPQFQQRLKTSILERIISHTLQNFRRIKTETVIQSQTPINNIQFREVAETSPSLTTGTLQAGIVRRPPPPIPPKPSYSIKPNPVLTPTLSEKRVLSPPQAPSADTHRVSIISENLASTYGQITSNITDIVNAVTRDPVVRREISNAFKEINIILCGSARVGKSTLVNAICEELLAKTSSGLDSCTQTISRYILKRTVETDDGTIEYHYNFWDTPGFENWNQSDISKNLETILKKPKSDILCMIYCASPGSFANLQQLDWFLNECMKKQIFCALVCTNKWGGQKEQRDAVMVDFQRLLTKYHNKTREDDGVIVFGNVGLCTAVNSQRYEDEEAGKVFEQSGVDQLILSIMESLDAEKVAQWCILTFKNKSFWKQLFNFPKRLGDFIASLPRRK